jgi:prepilin signal peptidase PulO-like enzyme (type II secretory pathway)
VIASATLILSAFVAFQRTPDPHRVGLGLAYLACLAFIAIYDVRTRRAPNRIVYPALVLALAGSLTLGIDAAVQGIAGGIIAFAVLLVIAIIGRGAMGLGDVKAGALCGIAVGLSGVGMLLALTFLIGLVVCAPLVVLRIYRRTDTIALTPFLAAATAITLSLGHSYLWP